MDSIQFKNELFRQTLVRNLWFGENLKEAIDSYRIHHQLLPMNFQYESGFPKVRKIQTKNSNNSIHSIQFDSEYCGEFEAEGSQRDGEGPPLCRLRHFGRVGRIDLRQCGQPQGRRRRRNRPCPRRLFLIRKKRRFSDIYLAVYIIYLSVNNVILPANNTVNIILTTATATASQPAPPKKGF
jgi:hypothetical protein